MERLQVMLTVGRAPYFTLYIKMLSCVFMNYLTLMPLFIFLITGFTLSLALTNQHYYEKKHENENRSFWEMFPKTISMSMGELDYSSLSKEFPTSVMARISAVFVFFAFVFGIIMVTMNVMNGLAVISTKEVKDEAELYKLISQLELIFMAEAFIQMCPRLGSFLGNTQFLSRSHNASCLLACINKDPKELILCTKEQEKGTRERLTKLDNDTADSLRYLRLLYLKEEKASKRLEEEKWLKLEESVKQINVMVHDLVNKLTPAQGAELHSEQ